MYRPLIVAAVAAIVAGPAHAHVSFENAQAAVGTTYKAVLRILHGCDGKATDEVRVRIPEGVIAVKPMPKAGWTIEKTVTGYKAEYDLHGKKVAEGVTELSWSGGSVADDEYDDEFVFRATLDASLPAGETIYFPVIQVCGTDRAEWTQAAAEGQTVHDLERPAPGLELLHGEHAGH
ncbi:DUF1775 domain-containing protein [Mesorhizobium sp.]|uniref:YcnI family protein n=1 Tax=Mesorhizobium sp. TaxID=1871066 RepID=UPI000FE3F35E|nr:DUF1775 domain-containing protein [Mesorhizobium sp.]RWN56711.1 MAG: DUF1775 domain-containing protein [Mesorhizobium sp.]RWN78222.1 MAG: DUF1775 domain-containing protein [Mesorhizobium sp.]RWN82164.1 MAG: DUF1775 domain-containing protein [Mesorhizobium sp.]RWN91531.1 MAG: DUF1775 domain-containing protein [Mesorhizobium sp.]RWO15954.1 MAG: DUF1775 domain-containing protein [Mesorhizobium sp.]